jgi:alanine racemase
MIQLHDLLHATGGRVLGHTAAQAFTDFCFDSRLVAPGQLFLAVRTNRGDGHDYIDEAVRGGAVGVLCERSPEPPPAGITSVAVGDVQQALTDWARYILEKQDTEVIGVTGSTGKTTTKEAIAAALSTRFQVFCNYANYSGRYGLPIALGRLERHHEIAVLELAADSFDEVRDLVGLTHPRVGVVTAVDEAHIEYLGSLEAIAQEKSRLVEALPNDGLAVLNCDDARVLSMGHSTRAEVRTYGLNPKADFVARRLQCSWEGLSFALLHRGEEHLVRLRLLGCHHVYAALAAIAVGDSYSIPLSEILSALAQLPPQMGRLCPLDGRGGSRLLDDTHSASPASALAALETLARLPAGRRIAVLGDMEQLGDLSPESHRQVGRRAADSVDYLITKGEKARWIAQSAEEAGLDPQRIYVTYRAEEAVERLRHDLCEDDVVLVKGSAEARMEEVVEGLLLQPERKRELLVRQNAGWQQISLAQPGRSTWVEVDLSAIAHNVRRLCDIVGPDVGLLAVVKADGYGHGAVKVARTALNNGASMVGVACVSEGIALRREGITAPILVLGYTPAWQSREALLNDITVTLFSAHVAQAFSKAAGDLNRRARCHVKVDTGMGRLGLLPHEAVDFLRGIAHLPHLEIEGLFTHFSVADSDADYTRWQLARFGEVLEQIRHSDLTIPYIHAANSAGLLTLPDARYNLVRAGIALYGLAPSPEVPLPEGFRPALAFKTQVAQVKSLPPGSYVSYGNTYRTQGNERIAVIPVGYADGFRRAPRHWGEVLVKGQRAPIVGRVCMDQTMINVTHVPHVRQGDEVVLIGQQGDEKITVDEVAERLGTINYEVVSEILARVPRMS